DLELSTDGSSVQTVGMRFPGLAIPKNAVISNAYVQFQVDEATTAATSLRVEGQAADNALTFTTAANNISSRARTTAFVNWAPAGWPTVGAAGNAQRTPDIANVIQEIVNRGGWNSGQALAIIITGTGSRVAESWDGLPAAAPLLHVDIAPPPTTTTTSSSTTTSTTSSTTSTTEPTTTTTLPTTTTTIVSGTTTTLSSTTSTTPPTTTTTSPTTTTAPPTT